MAVNNIGNTGDSLKGVLYYGYSTNGPWMEMNTSLTRPLRMTETAWYSNGDPTTPRLPSSNSTSTTFRAGQCVEAPGNVGETANVQVNTEYSNLEFCFEATDYAPRNTTYYFILGLTPEDQTNEYKQAWAMHNVPKLTIEDTDTPNPPVDFYVDNLDYAQTVRTGLEHNVNTQSVWKVSAITAGVWGANSEYCVAYNENTNAISSFRWIPQVLVSAQYNVYARWTAAPTRGRNIPYTIRHAGGTTPAIFVNQRDPALGGQWNLLGTYTFNPGTNCWVEMGGNDGQACADAIWLEQTGGMSAYEQWQQAHFTSEELADPSISGDAADPDNDGMTNLDEYTAGTDPRNTASVLAVVGLTGSGETLDLQWLSVDGKTYEILKSTNLLSGFTVTEATNIAAVPPTNSYPVTVGSSGSGFYRVSVE